MVLTSWCFGRGDISLQVIYFWSTVFIIAQIVASYIVVVRYCPVLTFDKWLPPVKVAHFRQVET